jgi:histo-blood group ABO system transferase
MKYVAGGIQGGPVDEYLTAASTIRKRIEQDYMSGITAIWHDESHWNRYVFDNSDDMTILGPQFCWPETWPVPRGVSDPRLLALDKNHHALRGTKPSVGERSKSQIRRLARGIGIERVRRAI